jgi:hypothetical protein
MDLFEKEIVTILVNSCRNFLKHGLEHALVKQKTDSDIVQAILNVQASLEVVAKLYQLRNEGWKSIVDKKHHSETKKNLLYKLKNGELKTHQYWKSKDYMESQIGFFSNESDLIKRFQDYRNSVAHLGLPNLPSDVESDILILLLRVINTLNWDESMPLGVDYIENHASKILGNNLFEKLLKHPTYIGEAVDQAYDNCSIVHKCLECGNESWGETDLDVVLCFTCGYKVPNNLIGFADCPKCSGLKSVVHDAIQGHGVKVPAKCTDCGNSSFLALCVECGHASDYTEKWECPICKDVS